MPSPSLVRRLDLAAASGLVRVKDHFFVVGDDELALHAYPDAGPVRRYTLRGGELPRDPAERKRLKPDLEALCVCPDGHLLALGSGSSPRRSAGFFVRVAEDMSEVTVSEFSLAPLHAALAERLPALNLEGAVWRGDDLVLLQRGNGRDNVSALIRLDAAAVGAALRRGAPWTPDLIRGLAPLELGARDGVPYAPTDAALLPGGGLLLAAAAEASADTYADGECRGSALFRLDPPERLLWRVDLPGDAKIEGVWAAGDASRVRVHLVADPDDPAARSPLFTLTLDPTTGALA